LLILISVGKLNKEEKEMVKKIQFIIENKEERQRKRIKLLSENVFLIWILNHIFPKDIVSHYFVSRAQLWECIKKDDNHQFVWMEIK
jgi:hypothetical protein